ncbi:MAG: hypothetical protein E7477_01885 [Ruminococcaceae bacterium]|nr:hypothetical protein [Oscillospiraceae bacterium]
MLTKTSVFDANYFRYILKKVFPYSLVMALVLVLSSFLFYNFGSPTHITNSVMYYDPMAIGATANVFMYIIPIALSVGMFGFLHKKNSTDFIFGAPVRRSALFSTNVIAAFIIIAVTLLLNFGFVALIIECFQGNVAYVAPQNYILMYFYNLAGYMLVYIVASLAATLTGTAISQILLTIVITLLPAYLLCFVQLPFVIQYSGGFECIDYAMSLNSIVLMPDVASAPLTMIFMEYIGSAVSKFYGQVAYFTNIRTICFTILLAAIYFIVGIYLFKRYRSENSGKAFINKGVNIFTLSGMFTPIMLIVFFILADGIGYDDMLGEALFYVFLVFIWVAFVVVTLIFNKGFSGFGKQMKLFFTLLITTCVVSGIFNFMGESSVKHFSFKNEDVKSITLYMEPINTAPAHGQNVKETYKKVTIKDPEMLGLLKRGNQSETYFFEFVCENGKKLTLRAGLSDSFLNALYDYIDSNENVKKSLFSFTGAKKILGSALTFKSQLQESKTSIPFTDKKEMIRVIAAKELEYLDTPIREIYMQNNYVDYTYSYLKNGAIEYYYEDYSGNYELLRDNSITLSLSALRYYNGQYYTSTYNIDYDSDFFLNFAEDAHKEMSDLLDDIENYEESFEASVAGAFELDDEKYIDIEGFIEALPSVMREEFIETIRKAIDEPLIPENTIGIYIANHYRKNIVFLNIDRDITPLIEKYFDSVTSILSVSQNHLKMAVGALIDGTEGVCSGFFSYESFESTPHEIAALLKENEDDIVKILTQKVTDKTIKNEYYFLQMTTDPYDTYAFTVNIPITTEILRTICPRFDYFDTKTDFLDHNNIESVTYDNGGTKITDREDIEYLTSLLKFHYFYDEIQDMRNTEDSYYYDYKFESYYSYYDLKFTTKDGQIEVAQIPETGRVREILHGDR